MVGQASLPATSGAGAGELAARGVAGRGLAALELEQANENSAAARSNAPINCDLKLVLITCILRLVLP
jgi:hypothetical protein